MSSQVHRTQNECSSISGYEFMTLIVSKPPEKKPACHMTMTIWPPSAATKSEQDWPSQA